MSPACVDKCDVCKCRKGVEQALAAFSSSVVFSRGFSSVAVKVSLLADPQKFNADPDLDPSFRFNVGSGSDFSL